MERNSPVGVCKKVRTNFTARICMSATSGVRTMRTKKRREILCNLLITSFPIALPMPIQTNQQAKDYTDAEFITVETDEEFTNKKNL